MLMTWLCIPSARPFTYDLSETMDMLDLYICIFYSLYSTYMYIYIVMSDLFWTLALMVATPTLVWEKGKSEGFLCTFFWKREIWMFFCAHFLKKGKSECFLFTFAFEVEISFHLQWWSEVMNLWRAGKLWCNFHPQYSTPCITNALEYFRNAL